VKIQQKQIVSSCSAQGFIKKISGNRPTTNSSKQLPRPVKSRSVLSWMTRKLSYDPARHQISVIIMLVEGRWLS
jgi:hypothetical protein